MVKPVEGGYKVFSKTGKSLSKIYPTHIEAEERLRQIEYFKHKLKEDIINQQDNSECLMNEAEYKGKDVELNKPFRTPDGPKKFGVYVKNDKGNVIIVRFGDPNMEIKRDDPERRKAYRARHKGDKIHDKTKAGYWSWKFWGSKSVSDLLKEDIDLNEIDVYHGSDRKFDVFDMNKIGSGDGKLLGGWGLYFSDSKDVSDRYKTNNGFIKPYEIPDGEYFNLDEELDETTSNIIVKKLMKKDISPEDIEQFRDDYQPFQVNNKQAYDWLSYVLNGEKNASLFIKDLGYIGNTFKDKWDRGATNYVLFDTNGIEERSEDEMLDMYESEQLKGGLSDDLSLKDIALKHNVDFKTLYKQYLLGLNVEREHTSNIDEIIEIVKDHLFEKPDYYSELNKIDLEESNLNTKSIYDYLFKEYPNLSNIGSIEQYKQYAESIFSNSKVPTLVKGLRNKSTLVHNVPNHFWFSDSPKIAEHYRDDRGLKYFRFDINSVDNFKSNIKELSPKLREDESNFINNSSADCIILDTADLGGKQLQYVIKKGTKATELGTEKDQQNFKTFVDKSNLNENNILRLPKELIGRKVIKKIFGGDREVILGKVRLEDLMVLDNGLETAKKTFINNPKFKVSDKPIVVGIDVDNGKKQLLDGYHRYFYNGGRGLLNTYFIPMKDGEIIGFNEISNEST